MGAKDLIRPHEIVSRDQGIHTNKKNILKFEVNEQKYIWNGTALISVDTAVQIISYESE